MRTNLRPMRERSTSRASLADAGRSTKARMGLRSVSARLRTARVLEDALLDLLQAVVVLVEILAADLMSRLSVVETFTAGPRASRRRSG